MKYIYDIVLNFNKEYYNFFEWDINDDIINIRKVPLFRINDESYLDIKYHTVVLDTEFIEKIKNQTLLYVAHNTQNICLLSNCKEVIAVIVDDTGTITQRSSLLFDEEDEVLELCEELKPISIKYKKGSPITSNFFTCRSEKNKKEKIIKLINELYDQENDAILKYLYYDIFEKEESDITYIKNKLIKSIQNKNNLERLYFIFNAIKKEII